MLQAGVLVCRGMQPLSILKFRVVGLNIGCFNFFREGKKNFEILNWVGFTSSLTKLWSLR